MNNRRYTEDDLKRARIDAKGEAIRYLYYLIERRHTQTGDFGDGQRYELRTLAYQLCLLHKDVTGEGLGEVE